METIKIKAVSVKMTTDKYTIYKIETEDGRVFDTFDVMVSGEEATGTVTPHDNPNYSSRFSKDKPEKKGGFAPKDYTSEKRMSALTNAVATAKLASKEVTTDNIVAIAEKYFTFLNNTK